MEREADAADGFSRLGLRGGHHYPEGGVGRDALAGGRYVGLDSRHRLLRFSGGTAAAPNLEEAAEATGMPDGDESGIERADAKLREEFGAEALVLTICADGMSLFELGTEHVHIPVAIKSEVFDVAGAGDTVVAAFALSRSRAPATSRRLASAKSRAA